MICPRCGREAETRETRYGPRSSCEPCGLWSWDFKPLVSADVHEARKRCHAIFDRVWQRGEEAYPEAMAEGRSPKKFRRITRVRGYRMIAYLTCMPEPECHMGEQTNLAKLAKIEQVAKTLTPKRIREWWQEKGRDWWNPTKQPVEA